MASKFVYFRLCCSTAVIQNRRYKQLFSSKALKEDIAGRLSHALDLPVSDSDGMSKDIFFLVSRRLSPSTHIAFRLSWPDLIIIIILKAT